MSKIQQSIEKLLEKHRILLWYDAGQSFTEEFESLDLENATKLEVNGNEFETKVRVLHREPDQKFLLYLPNEKPGNEENWLLDIELAHHVYHTDQEALYLQEVGLGYHYKQWLSQHIEFFKNKDRVASFREIAREEDGDHLLSLKLIQVVFSAETLSFELFLRNYASAFIQGREESVIRELDRFNLTDLFWQEVSKKYGYTHDNPSIYDFLLETFQKNFSPLSPQAVVNRETGVLLSSWKDTLSFQEDFKILSHRIQANLKVEEALNSVSIEEITSDDLFELIDQRVISELVRGIIDGSIDQQRLETVIKNRESLYWYHRYTHFYSALRVGFTLLETIRNSGELSIGSFDDGVESYINSWYKMDQHYRLFIQAYRETHQNNVLNPLYNEVNKAYSNTWLLRLSDQWQGVLDRESGRSRHIHAQTRFFRNHVKPFISKKTRLFVIISDALRYECGVSFHQQMKKENRFESEIGHQIAPLPSYTQLGMASLLPHQELSFGKGDEILADGKRTSGLTARRSILQNSAGVQATAVLAEELMKMASKSEEARELVANHDLIYIYHNRIDKLGDDKSSEEKVIEGVRDEIQFLIDLIKKVSNMGGYNMIVTADHGFIYQNDPLDESDFAEAGVEGEIIKSNRRFVLGRNLTHQENVMTFDCKDLGIEGDLQVLIPKSINRLRVHGAGSRFVHGGATLQELITPIIKIKKKREDTVTQVDVDVLNKRNNRISTNIQRVSFYQLKPVGEQIISRTLKVQFQSKEGESLSDVFTYTFDLDAPNSKDREIVYPFQISSKASEKYGNQEVYLLLEEQVEDSNKWIEYARYPYQIKISFTNDFDDF
ncbi:MAG: BREX-1 system phosphatase PglZ type A [Balneolaceae bacterium]|nr:MAG: BREX-1 system phosphatase PglZ type A [Balneolaceae bacterium]